MKAKVFLLALLIMNVFQVSAQNKDEVTLVVSADGATKDEAVKTALRSAIEQAYGTFVSANTTILNDELVKDEIVTISNGNIKNYNEVSSNQLPNGHTYVTLKVTVSISRLVSYAKSKGASTEFAGAAFAMNMKMKELNKKNEMAVLENLLVQMKQMLPYAFDRKLVIGTPKLPNQKNIDYHMAYYVGATVVNQGGKNIPYDRVDQKPEVIQRYIKQIPHPTMEVLNMLQNIQNYYEMTMEVQHVKNENTDAFFQMIFNTLKSIALTPKEMAEMKEENIPYSKEIEADIFSFTKIVSSDFGILIHLRNSEKDINKWAIRFRETILNEFSNFVITDNLGGRSYFKEDNILSYTEERRRMDGREWQDNNFKFYNGLANGFGLFSPMSFIKISENWRARNFGEYTTRSTLFYFADSAQFNVKLTFFIPKDKIMEYSNFSLERKSN